MPALANARHEKFVQERAKGLSIDAAYAAAGFSANRANASRLSQRAEVQERLAEVLGNIAEKVGIDQAYVISTIHETVERCRQAKAVRDRKGDIVLTETPTGDLAAAYVFDSKAVLRGAELLGKHLGMFKETPAEPPTVNVVIGDTELARLIAFQLTKASKQS